MTPPILLSADVIHQRIRELARRSVARLCRMRSNCICLRAQRRVRLSRGPGPRGRKPTTIDFLAVSSYAKGTTSTGEVRLLKDLDAALNGRDVLIVEDIVDTGLTLQYLQEILRARGPKSLRTACLLNKPSRRKVEVPVDYIGFTIEDRFVVGLRPGFPRAVPGPALHRRPGRVTGAGQRCRWIDGLPPVDVDARILVRTVPANPAAHRANSGHFSPILPQPCGKPGHFLPGTTRAL